MNQYSICDDKIIINNMVMDVEATLLSGQVFRWEKIDSSKFLLSTSNNVCLITKGDQETVIETNNIPYFINYFDFDNDYAKLLNTKDSFAKEAINQCPPLKILKQDNFETIISFLMSANNNIKRFTKTLKLIAKNFGEEKTYKGYTWYTFPSPKTLSTIPLEKLKEFGCGYRDKYLIETSKEIQNGFDLSIISELPTNDANKHLCKLLGIGEKVADCILLFSFQKYDAFPIDTWMEKVYKDNYNGKSNNRKEMRKYFIDLFGDYAGIIQQYLFYSKRN